MDSEEQTRKLFREMHELKENYSVPVVHLSKKLSSFLINDFLLLNFHTEIAFRAFTHYISLNKEEEKRKKISELKIPSFLLSNQK